MEHEHLEHVEHHSEHAHSPFDRRVAMTMAIVAAVLACVTLLSHRAHTETLRLQGEANRLQSQANIYHTRATDAWGFFQAKNIREHEYKSNLRMLKVMAKAPSSESDQDQARQYWQGQLDKYKVELPEMQDTAKELVNKAEELQKEAHERLEESEHNHHRADRFDLGELAVELALILCSVAVLTKQSSFWYGGMVSGIIGGVVAASGFLLH